MVSWIIAFFQAHSWARSWRVVEKASGERMNRRLTVPVLIFRITDFDDIEHEVAQQFPEVDRSGTGLTERLNQVEIAFEALHP